ncbi:MAG: GFA family protein [Sneathiella sp.]
MTAIGSCLCGSVSFEVAGDLADVNFCHCKQCQQWHGNFAAYASCKSESLTFNSEGSLKWFLSSDVARRGFCNDCGSSLFWSRIGSDKISIAAGCLTESTGLRPNEHIFVEFKGSYYSIKDDLPKLDGDN